MATILQFMQCHISPVVFEDIFIVSSPANEVLNIFKIRKIPASVLNGYDRVRINSNIQISRNIRKVERIPPFVLVFNNSIVLPVPLNRIQVIALAACKRIITSIAGQFIVEIIPD